MRYRNVQHPKNRALSLCLVLLGLTAICYILVLFFDYLISLNTHDVNEIVVDNSQIIKLDKSNKNEFMKLAPSVRSEKLKQIFRFHYSQLLSNHIKSKKLQTPTEHEIASLLSNIYLEWDEKVNFIQVGACDGDFIFSNDPIQKLLTKSTHWHGVMMEPVPYLFDKLKTQVETHILNNNERILLMNAALSDHNGPQPFYVVNEKFALEKPDETHALKHQIGSFNKDHIVKHLIKLRRRGELKEEVDAYISTIQVDGKTPDQVLKDFISSNKISRDGAIDLLLIDAEGFDLNILKSFMKIDSIRPNLIYYETLHLTTDQQNEAQKLLENYGYVIWPVGWNAMGIRVCDL